MPKLGHCVGPLVLRTCATSTWMHNKQSLVSAPQHPVSRPLPRAFRVFVREYCSSIWLISNRCRTGKTTEQGRELTPLYTFNRQCAHKTLDIDHQTCSNRRILPGAADVRRSMCSNRHRNADEPMHRWHHSELCADCSCVQFQHDCAC